MERGPQTAREVVERHARGGDLPGRDQPADELAVSVLAQRIERDAATREANGVFERAGRLGVGGQLFEHVAQALAVRLARLVDPFRVESRQQLTVAETDGLLQPSLPGEPLELPGVHQHVVADEADHVAGRHEPPSPAAPSAWRTATSSVRRLLRALESSTSGQKRPATSERGCMPECRASQPSSAHARPRSGIGNATPSDSSAKAPKRRTRSMATGYPRPVVANGPIPLVTRLRPCGVRVALGWQGRVPATNGG